jgi:diguanylate cyclase (GGDEF)-like protein/PAS domain S-box-containing protein
VTVSQRGERQPAAALVQVHDLSVGDRAAATERHLAAIVQSSEDAIFTKDLTGTVLSWNAGAERLYGYPASEIVGRSITTIIPPERQEEAMWVISQILEGHQPPHFETVRVRRDGERVDVSISATAIRDASNQVTSVAVVARDITERLRMARALGESERRYRQTFERNPQPMWIYDTQTLRFLDVNQRAIDAYGYSRAEFLAMTIRDIRPTEELPRLQDALSRGAYAGVDTFRHLKKSGEVIDAEVLSNEFDFAGRPARLVVAIDVTSRLRAEQLLRRHADHDALTGLFNRRRLQREIDAMLTRGGARDSCALIVLDIDHFKLVNDSFGHTRGDELVRRITEVLTGALDEGQVLGRLGGDEFAIAVPNVTEAQACEVTQKLLKHVKNNVVEGQHHVTASAGIAVVRGGRDLSSPAHQVSAEDLLVAADIALYQAKDAGRDRFALAGGIKRGHTWIDEVRAALHDDRLVLYAQPIIDLRTGSTVREELLIRMLSPDGDIIPPASFIPAAERFGLINEIDRWVVAQALELARGGRPLQINISARSFGDAAITRAVSEAVSRGVDPSSVVFEITETAAASNYREASDFAERLARAGCGLALDDFGTGFGTLSYLKHIPFNYLKIDMDFVRQLTREPVSQRIVKVIVRTARELGQKTIAEGVEHPATLPILQGLGVDMAQGYHIGPPIPIERTAAQAA